MTLHAADSYYAASRRYAVDAEALRGARKAEVAIIGGGITGVSAALHLAERGVDVALLEARQCGWGASGRSGGQILPGFAADQRAVERWVGREAARALWAHSAAAVAQTRARIARHRIDCDWTPGYLHAAVKPGQARDLQRWAEHLRAHYDCAGWRYLDRRQLREVLATSRYSGAVFDPHSGHLHPLNYCLGLAQAAQEAGARLYQNSAVTGVESDGAGAAPANPITVRTAAGAVTCAQVIYACNAYLERLQPRLAAAIMPVGTYIIATEKLPAETANALIANRAAVADTNLVLDYYRLSADHRMLFGGRVSYSARQPRRLAQSLRRRMLAVFPQLAGARIDFAWGGLVAITRNRAPHIGRLDSDAGAGRRWFAHGFSGHGMAMSGYAGGLLAAAVCGESRGLDGVADFRRIPHKNFPGGPALRAPLLVTVMAGRRLLDKLSR
ncbi:MAG: FAD-binding oxidoreductase [Gammaproteobacteria bacterium]|nr:FAD-binding oxidoreductase [Gammaproteobacteria bacterium]